MAADSADKSKRTGQWILSARLASREQRWTVRMAMGSPALHRRPKERQETDVKKGD
jgi:hypothetical protein